MERSAASISEAADLGQCAEHPSEHTGFGQARLDDQRDARPARDQLLGAGITEGALRRFAADASHELRTPLTSIRGYAELTAAAATSPSRWAQHGPHRA